MNWCFSIWAFSLILFLSLEWVLQNVLPAWYSSLVYHYLRATCHLFISFLVLCSHLNNCAKRVSRCVVTCTQADANVMGEQSTFVSVMPMHVCVLCLEIKQWCDYATVSISHKRHSSFLMNFSRVWITTVHTSGEPSDPRHCLRHADTHTEPLKLCQGCACLPTLWAQTTQLCCLKPLSLGLFVSADVWTHEAGFEVKTLQTHDRSRKSLFYVLYNLFSFYLSLSKLRCGALTSPV